MVHYSVPVKVNVSALIIIVLGRGEGRLRDLFNHSVFVDFLIELHVRPYL